MAGREVQQRRAVVRDVRLGVDAGVVAVEEAQVLQAVAGQRVVGVGGGQRGLMGGALPAKLAEELTHSRWRVVSPTVLPEQVAGGVPL